jgi:hypothetical protein
MATGLDSLSTVVFFDSFVDRDMVMRYHWGLSVGHIYGHECAQARESQKGATTTWYPNLHNTGREDDPEIDGAEDNTDASDDEDFGSDSGINSDSSDTGDFDDDEVHGDAELLEMDEMYGDSYEADFDFYD